MGCVWYKNYSKEFHKNVENYLVRWRPLSFSKIAGSKTTNFLKMSLIYFYTSFFFGFCISDFINTIYKCESFST